MTPYTLKMSFCIPTTEGFRKTIQIRKFVVKVTYSIKNDFNVNEMTQWLENQT